MAGQPTGFAANLIQRSETGRAAQDRAQHREQTRDQALRSGSRYEAAEGMHLVRQSRRSVYKMTVAVRIHHC